MPPTAGADLSKMQADNGTRPQSGPSSATQSEHQLDTPAENPGIQAAPGGLVETQPTPAPGPDGDFCYDRSVWALLNPFNIAKNIGCELRTLFIPSSTDLAAEKDSVTESAKTSSLGVIVGTIVGLIDGVRGGAGTGLGGSACGPSIGWGGADGSVANIPGFAIVLPSPEGCPGNGPAGTRTDLDAKAGDLLGYRTLVRGMASFGLVYIVLMSFLRAAPWTQKSDDLAPGEVHLQAGSQEYLIARERDRIARRGK